MKPRPSRTIPRRDMTTDEITMALALSPAKIRYVPGTSTKRFAWSMADQAEHGTPPTISIRQAEYLITLCIRMRRQIPADVLAIAERLARRPQRRPGGSVALALLTFATVAGGARCALITEGTVLAIAILLILVPAGAAIVAAGILLIDALRARRRNATHTREVEHG